MAETQGPKLRFKAVNEGLGFHPFAEGLPYAPPSSPAPSTPAPTPASPRRPALGTDGAGAVAAGPARFVHPTRSAPVARPAPLSVPAPAPPITASPAAPAPAPESRYGFFYVAKRLLAFGFDSLVNLGLAALALGTTLWRQELARPEVWLQPQTIAMATLFFAVFNWSLITAQEVIFGTSFGKRLLGLHLRGPVSALFLRAFFFWPSVLFGGLGLAWALFNRRRRCWHDSIVDLQPIEIASVQ